jgi:hypothetical protein
MSIPSNTPQISSIIIDGVRYYIKKIDNSHLILSMDESYPTVCTYHIDQLSHRPYYKDLKEWLNGRMLLSPDQSYLTDNGVD